MVAVLILKPVVLIVRFNRGVPDPKIRIFDLGRKKVGKHKIHSTTLVTNMISVEFFLLISYDQGLLARHKSTR